MTKRLTLATLALIMLLAPTATAREVVRGHNAPPADPIGEELSALPDEDRLEELIREVYATYQSIVGKSGQNLRFRLREFKTTFRNEFGDHKWLDLMPPDTGMTIAQQRAYYNAPWARAGKVVHYELRWQQASERRRENAALEMKLLHGISIAGALDLERTVWKRKTNPLAITSVIVDVEFAGRTRTYQAAAFWNGMEQDGDMFKMDMKDPVVPDVAAAMLEDVLPVTREELRDLRRDADRKQTTGHALVGGTCEQKVDEYLNKTIPLQESQGHQDGAHRSELRLATDCHYSSECQVQCLPEVFFSSCREVGNVDLPFLCEHTPHRDFDVSGNSAVNKAISCGAAVACGIKECCGFQILCGGVELGFSGSGGGYSASASNTGNGETYNLSVKDSFECPAPTQKDPCAGSNLTASSRIAAGSCVDGPDGSTESPPGDGTQCTDSSCNESPILIDLGGAGIVLSSLVDGVSFDIVPGGAIEQIAWTVPQSPDGFLALDRNGNGMIDDGSELFGNNTPQPPSAEPNGFRALAVFDRPERGGDADGWITAGDAIFPDLHLWRDVNHDGRSDPGELLPLSAAGIEAIEFSYVESRRRDRHGNQFRYKSRVRLWQSTTEAVDVFLLSQ